MALSSQNKEKNQSQVFSGQLRNRITRWYDGWWNENTKHAEQHNSQKVLKKPFLLNLKSEMNYDVSI